jgi:quercetin dioxygenase-like cupin family protein
MPDETKSLNAILSGQAGRLETLIDWQNDSVVSKTIIGKKTGTVTLFAFDKGQGLSEHTAPFEAIVYLVDGEAEITVDRKPHRVKKGEMIILPANIPHALSAITPFKMLLTMIKSQ